MSIVTTLPKRLKNYTIFQYIETTKNSCIALAIEKYSKNKNQKIILKFIPLNEHIPLDQINNECEIQSSLCHPYIMPISRFFDEKDFRIIEMPRACKSLSNLYTDHSIPDPIQAYKIMYKVLHAMNYIHTMKILHGDIKPDNIVLMEDSDDGEPNPRIIDFGHAQCFRPFHQYSDEKFDDLCYCHRLTYSYGAPEQLQFKPHSFPSDIWALGATFYYLITNEVISPLADIEIMRKNVYHLNFTFSKHLGPDFPESGKQLIRQMMDPDPMHRPTALECLKSEFFVEMLGYDWIQKEEHKISMSTSAFYSQISDQDNDGDGLPMI